MDRVYKSIEELMAQAKKLESKSLYDLYGEKYKKNGLGKGDFGNKVEVIHYGIENNNRPGPDVENLGVEIKTNPLNLLKDGSYSPKESVSLGMINFTDLCNESFETSSYLNKNNKILYNMYHYIPGQDVFFNKVLLTDIITPSEADLKVIKNDWEFIQNKAKNNKADELSQSDTNYLIAMTKGSKGQIPQPYGVNKIAKAKRRAFAYRGAYIRYLLSDYTLVEELGEAYYKKKKSKPKFNLIGPNDDNDLEHIVLNKFKDFIGQSDFDIAKHFNKESNFVLQEGKTNLNKSRWHYNTSLVLTGEQKQSLSKHIDEFAKSGLTVKTVRLNKDSSLCEQVSFKTQNFETLLANEWEESSLFQEMSCKFLWVVYKEDDNGIFRLFKTFFWKMPDTDLDFLSKKWLEFKGYIAKEDFRAHYFQKDESFYFLKIKDRVGGANKHHKGINVTNLSHWFQRDYVEDMIKD